MLVAKCLIIVITVSLKRRTTSFQGLTTPCNRLSGLLAKKDDDFSGSALEQVYRRRQYAAVKAREKTLPPPPPGPVGMRDRRVQSSQEPRNEVREVLEPGNWGLLALPWILLRYAGIFAIIFAFGWLLTDNYDTYNELVKIPIANRLTLSAVMGASASFFSALRLFGQWNYIKDRLTETNLYFEQTGWADGFKAQKPQDTIFRDKILRDEEILPRLATVQQSFLIALAVALSSLTAFILVWR